MVAAALALLLVGGCAGGSGTMIADGAPSTCGAASSSEKCLLAEAAMSLVEIEELGDWIAAASEYAEALVTVGRDDEARKLLERALEASQALPADDGRLAAQLTLAKSVAAIGPEKMVLPFIEETRRTAAEVSSPEARYDAQATLAALPAMFGDRADAMRTARTLPEGETLSSLRSRAFREIAAAAASHCDFDTALAALAEIRLGLPYYQSVARSEVAGFAINAGRAELANDLLLEAEQLARADPDGYFSAGALRDVAVAYERAGDEAKARALFADAAAAAKRAATAQQRARALSRVVTGMADVGLYSDASALLAPARQLAAEEPSEAMRNFSLYEIAGSAAFAGEFDAAQAIARDLPQTAFGSATSLRAATLRDIAWGRARNGDLAAAAALARSIPSPRERVQALSRIVRLLANPQMDAFPRYL